MLSEFHNNNQCMAFIVCGDVFLMFTGAAARSEPTAERLAISDMHVSSGRTTSYVLEFEKGGETLSLDVEPELYDRVQPGDTVYVVTNRGAFGIEYATVWTVDEWNYRY